jgi:dihydrofolate synthase/folylpolyglutamate synthase
MIEAMLRAAGERTGLFTSPHLHRETERYRIDGVPLESGQFLDLIELVRPHVEPVVAEFGALTTFDLRTALAFLAFREAGVSWQVIEVGMCSTTSSSVCSRRCRWSILPSSAIPWARSRPTRPASCGAVAGR